MTITEFDEQATSPEGALLNVYRAIRQYLRGEETLTIVAGYELAAYEIGVEIALIENAWRKCKSELGGNSG